MLYDLAERPGAAWRHRHSLEDQVRPTPELDVQPGVHNHEAHTAKGGPNSYAEALWTGGTV